MTSVNSRENCKAKGGKIYEPKNVFEIHEIAKISCLPWGIAWPNWYNKIIYNNPHFEVRKCYLLFS